MKIAIVGGAPGTKDEAPFGQDWQMWVLGHFVQTYDSADAVFEVHQKYEDSEYFRNIVKAANGLNARLITWDNYPYEQIDALNNGERYLTSTIAYMFALAILEGATEIGMFGVDMSVDDDEYRYQRPCLEHWRGVAIGRGINVTLPKKCPIGKWRGTYGLDDVIKEEFNPTPFKESEFLALARMHGEKIEQYKREISALQRVIDTHDGCKQSYERMAKTARAVDDGMTIKSLQDAVSLK